MDQFEQRLQQMQGNYENAKTQQEQLFGGSAVDAGIYEARLSSAAMCFSKKKGTLQIKRTHIITTPGNFEGVPVTDFMNLETEYGFAFARRWIEICGKAVPAEAAKLKSIVDQLGKSHLAFRIEVRRDGDFTNVAVMEMITNDAAPSESDSGTDDSAGDSSGSDDNAGSDTSGAEDETLAALKAFAVSQDLEIADEDDLETVKEKISAYNYESEKLTAEERELLAANDLGGLIQFPAKKEAPKPSAKTPAKPAAAPAKKTMPPKRR